MIVKRSEAFVSGHFELERLYRAGALAGAALLIEHLICYDPDEHTQHPERVLLGSNVLGVLTLIVAYAYAKRSWRAGLELFTVALIAGAVVAGIRYARHNQRIDRAVHFLAGRIIERVKEARDDDQGYARNGTRNYRA